MPIYKKVNKDFFKIWSREMAYVLGFFAADGYITNNKRGASFWSIQITDKELLYEIRRVVGAEHVISERGSVRNKSVAYRLQVGSKEMVSDLCALGLHAKKARTVKLPPVPKKYLADFVRGYFDGDGNVWVGHVHKERKTKTKVISTVFTSCSKEFLLELKKIMSEEFSLEGGSLIAKNNSNAFVLKYSIMDSLKISYFMYNRRILRTSKLFLERKKTVFEEYKNTRP